MGTLLNQNIDLHSIVLCVCVVLSTANIPEGISEREWAHISSDEVVPILYDAPGGNPNSANFP